MSEFHPHPKLDMERLDALLRRALVFNHISDAIIVTAPDGTIRDWNAGAEEMFGWSRAEALGKTPAYLHRQADAPTLWPSMHTVVTRKGRWDGRLAFVRKDGSEGWCESVAVPLLDPAGNVWGTLLVKSEIKDTASAAEPVAPVSPQRVHWSAESPVTDSRFLLRALIDAVPDAMFCKDREGRYLLLNEAHRILFAVREDEALGQTVFDFPGLRDNAALYHADDLAVVQTGEPVVNREEPFARPNGETGWLVTSKFPLRDEAGKIIGLAGVSRDITQVKQAARDLQAAQQRLLDHVENSPLAVIEWEPDLRIARWAGRAEAIFGWSSAEVVGRRFGGFPFVHPEDRAKVRQAVARVVGGEDRRNTTANRNLRKDGGIVHAVWHNSVLQDPAGRIVSILSLVQDVSDRVAAKAAGRKAAAERQALERKLQETQKLESLGVLAGGIAHDFNNLLSGVLGNASLARMDLPEDSPVQPFLAQIENAARRAADLCKQMLAYSGRGRFVLQRLDLNVLLNDTARLLEISASKNVDLQFHLAENLPPVVGDATQLRQVVMNLVINASEAVGEKGGGVSLSTGLVQADRAYLADTFSAPDVAEGDYVFLEVADNGAGMTPEVVARIFDPFFTTKFTGRGLGLAAVLGIVRGHRGALKVTSQPGAGTTFRILLPCVSGPADAPEVPAPDQSDWRGHGTVLVVDDEETVRVTTARMMEALGFTVRQAEDGRSALEIFRAAPSGFDLVVLDLTMPHLNGVEAFHEITALRPGTRVLLVSGYNEQEAVARLNGQGLAGFLQKPFNLPTLRSRLQQVFSPQ